MHFSSDRMNREISNLFGRGQLKTICVPKCPFIVTGCVLTGTYKLPQGVFLFLGYSEADKGLLKPLINMEVEDAVMSLQAVIKKSIKPKVRVTQTLSQFRTCYLSLLETYFVTFIQIVTICEQTINKVWNWCSYEEKLIKQPSKWMFLMWIW